MANESEDGSDPLVAVNCSSKETREGEFENNEAGREPLKKGKFLSTIDASDGLPSESGTDPERDTESR